MTRFALVLILVVSLNLGAAKILPWWRRHTKLAAYPILVAALLLVSLHYLVFPDSPTAQINASLLCLAAGVNIAVLRWRELNFSTLDLKSSYALGGLMLLMLAAFIVRWPGIQALPPLRDEMNHLLEARYGSSDIVVDDQVLRDYSRSQFVTSIASQSFQITGSQAEWVARAPGVVVSALSTILIFLVALPLGRGTAILSATAWAFSPWSISLSHFLREYTYFAAVYPLLGFIVWQTLHHLRKRELTLTACFWYAAASLGLVLCIASGKESTLRIGIITYLAAALWLWIELLRAKTKRWIMYLATSLAAVYAIYLLIAGLFLNKINITQLRFLPGLDASWLSGLLSDSDIFVVVCGATFAAIGCGIFIHTYFMGQNRPSRFGLFTILNVGLGLYFFTFHFDRYFALRYAEVLHIWLLLCMVVGALWAWRQLPRAPLAIRLSVVILVVNWLSLYRAVTVQIDPIERQDYVTDLTISYMQDVAANYATYWLQPSTAIVSTSPQELIWLSETPAHLAKFYSFDSTDASWKGKLLSVIERYASGWLVVDAKRNTSSHAIAVEDQIVGNYTLCLLATPRNNPVFVWKQGYEMDECAELTQRFPPKL